jgi:hypothetical protein
LEKKTIYQTLENRGNPEEVESHGPYKCSRNNSWLGTGCYFWDTFIDNAHWWGKVSVDDNYIICQANIDFHSNTCFDLVGNTQHMIDFEKSVKLLKSKKLIKSNTTTARVLNHLRNTLKIFDYSAIRVYGINTKSESYKPSYLMKFNLGKPQYLDYKPAIQICVYKYQNLNFRDFNIVYPDDFVSGYVV